MGVGPNESPLLLVLINVTPDAGWASGAGVSDRGAACGVVRAWAPNSTGVPSELNTNRDLPVMGLEKSSNEDSAFAGAIQQRAANIETMARCIESTPHAAEERDRS